MASSKEEKNKAADDTVPQPEEEQSSKQNTLEKSHTFHYSNKGLHLDSIDLDPFIVETLRELDIDGDGHINPLEFAEVVRQYKEHKAQNKHLVRTVIFLAVFLFSFLGVLGGLVYAVVELSKETRANSDGVISVNGDSDTAAKTGILHLDPKADNAVVQDKPMQRRERSGSRRRALLEHPLAEVNHDLLTHETRRILSEADATELELVTVLSETYVYATCYTVQTLGAYTFPFTTEGGVINTGILTYVSCNNLQGTGIRTPITGGGESSTNYVLVCPKDGSNECGLYLAESVDEKRRRLLTA